MSCPYNKIIEKESTDELFIIAVSKNKIVGHAYLLPMKLQAIKHVYRLTIVVHPNFVHMGICSFLMDYLIEYRLAFEPIYKFMEYSILNVYSVAPH